ncbi:hypothetical protein HYX12_02120 [Candidatus Woesearchaeota archaeon]|nr:hypothetical protein [Candidatus Woesearchaeota archaeon]
MFTANINSGEITEFLVRQWTVGGLFYTKGIPRMVIWKLKRIAKKASNKEVINPAWINRNSNDPTEIKMQLKNDFPLCFGEMISDGRTIIKKYPLYEIDHLSNTWKIVYVP